MNDPVIHPDPDGEHRRLALRRGRTRSARRARPARRWWRWLLLPALAAVLLSVLVTASLRWLNPPISAFMLAARLAAREQPDFTITARWVAFDAISPWAGAAVIAAEDQNFPRHHGFDFSALRDVLSSQRPGTRLRGASTLSQQLAKNLYLWSGRSWLRKGLEAWFTVLLETFLTKTRILELYLNCAEFGRGVYGVEAASARYFGHRAATLSATEAATLAAVLPNPRRFSVTAPSAYTRGRQRWIAQQMRQSGGVGVVAGLGR